MRLLGITQLSTKKTKVTKAARRRREVDIVRVELALKNELKEVWE
jgi:hypothetical protein